VDHVAGVLHGPADQRAEPLQRRLVERRAVRAISMSVVSERIQSWMNSTVSWLAISPRARPPTPSHTTNSPRLASARNASSL
jgi:hypothetical protein